MKKAERKKSKAALEELLDLYGYEYDIPSPGHYRVEGYIYHYKCKGYARGGWHYFDSHFDFVQSL